MNEPTKAKPASDPQTGFFVGPVDARQAYDLLAQLVRVADPSAAYAPPVTQGSRTVVLASEITATLGVGFGAGEDMPAAGADPSKTSHGSGGGGGGFSAARPVAAITIDNNGVTVQPVVDVTKLGIAALTALGAMALAWMRMRRAARKQVG